MLDTISASYCALKSIGELSSAPNLQQVDVSFNQIEKIDMVLRVLYTNQKVHTLACNDNQFNYNIQQEQ